MGNTKYTYAVARIRALEVALFSDAVIEQLLSCKTAAEALQFVVEKGWGDMADQDDPDWSRQGVPHVRGDEPGLGALRRRVQMCSPRAWG